MIRVYIASPYTLGDQALNVRKQMDIFNELANTGKIAPFAPLLFHFQHLVHPRRQSSWMEIDLNWVRVCDALLRLPGTSKGADEEVAFAQSFNIPVFYTIEDLKSHFFIL